MPARHAASPSRLPFDPATASARLAALAGIGAFTVAGLTLAGPAPAAQSAAAAAARADSAPAPALRTSAAGTRAPRARHAGTARPFRLAAAERPDPARTRYVPSGTGMWIYQWRHTAGGNAGVIVRRAVGAGLSTLYLRTGSTWDGPAPASRTRALLSAAAGRGISVVAWDFPRLRHPERDARRLAGAARVRGPHGERVAAVAPDVETPAEGTFNAAWRVRAYLRALRRDLPRGTSILTAVPWPSRYRLADYPYAAVAAGSDVLIPMAYWYDRSPVAVTAWSLDYLRRFHRPVEPVGQGYDGKAEIRSLPHNDLSRQVPQFLHTARRHGARAVSLWSWQSAPPAAWRALGHARHTFR